MLHYKNTFSSFSVNDLGKAKDFYQKKLGLKVEETPEGLSLQMGNGQAVFLYPKPNHEPATFTVFNFKVDNIDKTVDELTASGVKMLHYDGDIQTDAKGIMRGGGTKGPTIAWFADPAGNILSVVEDSRKN